MFNDDNDNNKKKNNDSYDDNDNDNDDNSFVFMAERDVITGDALPHPLRLRFSRPFRRSFAPVMAGATTSQWTAAVPAKAPDAARLAQ